MLVRLAAVVFLALAAAAAAVEMVGEDVAPPPLAGRSLQAEADALRERQKRCLLLGEAAGRDAHCLRVWAETRDRFLRPSLAAPTHGSDGEP